MSRSLDSLNFMPSELDEFVIVQESVSISTGFLADNTQCAGQQSLEVASSSNMISMTVGVQSEFQLETQIIDQLGITRCMLKNWKKKYEEERYYDSNGKSEF